MGRAINTAISVSNLSYRYPISGFTLSCSRLDLSLGELTLITGPNGSGKTTLSKLLCGILRPERGELRIFGRPAQELSLGEIGGRVGYLFQDPSRQLFAGTLWQEMIFADEVLGRDLKAAEDRARTLLKRFGLLSLAKRSVYHLSRGEKQRLALCTILMGGADYIILDEPTIGLDGANRNRLYSVVDELLRHGKGLAVISHEGELITRYSTRQVRLEQGRVVA
ncbi:MAG: ABC transporter ATP-binding protein [Bacillota bacterium]|nr:ABC transporter ATP-binding protein [Bacillota bacterium]HHT91569.1 ABC transporter ATP-binding protein [Bacillota bacterium]